MLAKKLFDLFMKMIALILAIALVISLIATLVGFNVERLLLDPIVLKSLLQENQIYSDVLPQLFQGLIRFGISDQAPTDSRTMLENAVEHLTDDDWIELVNILISADWTQLQVEGAIDALFAWLEGEQAGLRYDLDLGLLKQRFDQEAKDQIAERLVASWPECLEQDIKVIVELSAGEISQEIPLCQPAGRYASFRQPVIASVSSFLDGLFQTTELPDQLVFEPGGIDGERMVRIQRYFSRLQVGARWSPLIILALMGLILLAVRSWAAGFRWWSIPLVVGGLLSLSLALIAEMASQALILPFAFSLPEAVTTALVTIIHLIFNPISKAIMIQAAVITGVGLSMYAGSHLLARRGALEIAQFESLPRSIEVDRQRLETLPHTGVREMLTLIGRDLKLRRTNRLLLRSLWITVFIFGLGKLLMDLFAPGYGYLIPFGSFSFLVAGVIWATWRKLPAGRLARRLDARFTLFDQSTAALEVESARTPLTYLQGLLLAQAIGLLQRIGAEVRGWPRIPWLEIQSLLATFIILGGAFYASLGFASESRPALETLPPFVGEPLSSLADNPRLFHPFEWDTTEKADESDAAKMPANSAQAAMQILAEAFGDEAMAADLVGALQHGDPESAAEALRRMAAQSGNLSDATLDSLAKAMRASADPIAQFAPDLANQLLRTAGVLDGTGVAAQALLDGAKKLSEISPLYSEMIEQLSDNVAANDYAAAAETLQQAADLMTLFDPQLAQNMASYVEAVANQDIQAIGEALEQASAALEQADPDLARELTKTGRALKGETPGLTARALEDLAESMATMNQGGDSSPAPGDQPSSGMASSLQAGDVQAGGAQAGDQPGGGLAASVGNQISESKEETSSEIVLDSLNTEVLSVELDPAETGGKPATGPAEGPPSISFASQAGFIPVQNTQEELSRTGYDLLIFPRNLTDAIRTYFSPRP